MSDLITLRIDDREVRATLERLARRADNRAPLMAEIAGIMAAAVEANFRAEGRPLWRKLAAATIRGRQAKGHWPGRILQVRGRLAASVQERSDNDRAAVGTNVKYARIHQLGGQAGRGRRTAIPARPFLHLEPSDLRRIMEAARRHIEKP